MDNLEIEQCKAAYRELQQQLSHARKLGCDTFIAELKIKPIPSKLMMALATQQDKELQAAQQLVRSVQQELAEAMEKFLNEQEQQLMLELQFSSPEQKMKKLIEAAEKLLSLQQKERAQKIYALMIQSYNALPEQAQQAFYKQCAEIGQHLQ